MNRVVSYSIGLALALVLTLTAFSFVFMHQHGSHAALATTLLIPAILILAMVQLVVQLVFFLNLGREKDSQWNAGLFCFTFFGILVIVLASVWIMSHLNYNMTPSQIDQYTNEQSSF